jgi:hypothetical protein
MKTPARHKVNSTVATNFQKNDHTDGNKEISEERTLTIALSLLHRPLVRYLSWQPLAYMDGPFLKIGAGLPTNWTV